MLTGAPVVDRGRPVPTGVVDRGLPVPSGVVDRGLPVPTSAEALNFPFDPQPDYPTGWGREVTKTVVSCCQAHYALGANRTQVLAT